MVTGFVHRLLTGALALGFVLQVLVVLPAHAVHDSAGATPVLAAAKAAPAAFGQQSPSAPGDDEGAAAGCRCDFCLHFSALDPASAQEPLVLTPLLTAGARLEGRAALAWTSPLLFALARGPPAAS